MFTMQPPLQLAALPYKSSGFLIQTRIEQLCKSRAVNTIFNHSNLIWHLLNVFGAKWGDRRQKRVLGKFVAHIMCSRETTIGVHAQHMCCRWPQMIYSVTD